MTPQFVEDIRDQVGRGLRGGLCYVGAHNLVYGLEPRPFLRFDVNGARGQGWKEVIEVDEGSDSYIVSLINKKGEVLDKVEEVYADTLQSVVESIYDSAINKFCGGWIPLE